MSGPLRKPPWEVFVSAVTLIIALQIQTASMFSMLSQAQLYVLNAGESVDLDCEFYTTYFHLFDNPVLWTKSQFNEDTRINIMGNINQPFVADKRFEVAFHPLPPRYRLTLSISQVTLGDSGNYTCEVRGPQTVVLTKITHRIFVRAPVEALAIERRNHTRDHFMKDFPHSQTIMFREHEPGPLQCIATGGNPPPDMKVFLGEEDISHLFKSVSRTSLSGVQGLRTMHSTVTRWTDSLVLQAADDGKLLRCTAMVPGLTSNVTSSVVQVYYAPRIKCYSSTAYVGDNSVHVECEVRARPRVTTLFWIVDINGTTVAEGQVINEYWTLVTDRSDGVIETKLYMRHSYPENFRRYTVVAENVVGIKRGDANLVQKYKDRPGGGSKERPGHGRATGENGVQSHRGYIFIKSSASCLQTASRVSVLLSTFLLPLTWSISATNTHR